MKARKHTMIRRLSFWLVRKYRHSTLPQSFILLMDVVLFVMAFFLMEAFRTYGLDEFFTRGALIKLIWSAMLTIILFLFTGAYKGIIRHAGMSECFCHCSIDLNISMHAAKSLL